MKRRLIIVAILAALFGCLAANTQVVTGQHWQVIVGTDHTGYVNVSGNGVILVQGEWTS